MSRIKILPENLANRIAAGEVIERPASVVKEFVENAIDACARHITVQIEGGGTRLIRVIDDGEGMDQDDILLSLERHATSKLIDEKQLSAISTLGFRGEAVPSIASVSRMTITSRTKDSDLGSRVEINNGRIVKVHEMGCAKGTVMEVRDLFGNMPARKKFLKSTQTELFHIEEIIKNYTIAYPQLGFAYQVEGRDLFACPADVDDLETRVRLVGGKRDSGGNLVRLEEAADDVRVHGFLAPPDEMTGAAGRLRLFVNGRVVKDRLIVHALSEGLRGFMMKGARPAGALFVEVPLESVDVNVHPTKQEIRFHRPSVVHQLISLAAREGINRYQRTLKSEIFKSAGPKSMAASAVNLRERVADSPEKPVQTNLLQASGGNYRPQPYCKPELVQQAPEPILREPDPVVEPSDDVVSSVVSPDFLQPIGQLLGTYILCESDDGLVVIDQHAAQERLFFEEMKRNYASRTVAKQTLLFPKIIECDVEELQLLERFGTEISALGVDIEPFGGDSCVVKAVPAIVSHLGADVIVRDFLAQLAVGSGGPGAGIEAVMASMACKAAIKAGQVLQPEEITALIRKMREADVFSHCPHGRPVVKHFTEKEVRRWFYRG